MPSSSNMNSSTPGSSDPGRVPIGNPSIAVNPIVVPMLRPPCSAAMLAPLPRWKTTVRPAAARPSRDGSTEATYSYESPWNP